MKISFVIVTWNCRNQIEQCLASISSLGIPGAEVVVVDQASRDGTAEYLRSLDGTSLAHRIGLKYYPRQSKGNWCRNNEFGFAISKSEWIACSNPDIVFNDSFRTMVARIEALGPSYPLHGCRLPRTDGDLATTPLRNLTLAGIIGNWTKLGVFLDSHILHGFFHRVYYVPEYLLQNKRMVILDHPIGSLFLFHRSLLESLGGRLWEKHFTLSCADSDMFRSAKAKHIPVIFHADISQLHQRGYAFAFDPRGTQIDFGRGAALYLHKWGYSVFTLRVWFALDVLFRGLFRLNPSAALFCLQGSMQLLPRKDRSSTTPVSPTIPQVA